MNLANKKRMAARLLKVGESRVWFDPERLSEIKEAITKADIRRLIQDYAVQAKPATGVSRFRAKKIADQKRKGRQAGEGSKKGTFRARLPKKQEWMAKIRSQRFFLKDLKDKELVKPADYRKLYLMCKGSFFRSIRHIKLYMEEHSMFAKKEKRWSANKVSGPSKEQE